MSSIYPEDPSQFPEQLEQEPTEAPPTDPMDPNSIADPAEDMTDPEHWNEEEDTEPLPMPNGQQLKLSDLELKRIGRQITDDYANALGDHRSRMSRFARYYEAMRRKIGMAGGEEGRSNFSVPLTKWQVFSKLAKEMDALQGDDAEIVGIPVGPSDTEGAKTVGSYMTWRVFNSMRIWEGLTIFNFRRIVFGRTHAYVPYVREEFDSAGRVEVDYEGPRFCPLWPDDLIVPAEDHKSIDEFSFVIRKYYTTPNDILQQAGSLYFDSVADPDTFKEIYRASLDKKRRDAQGDELKFEKDIAEGVLYDSYMSAGEGICVHEWYGRWRLPKGKDGGALDNFKRRDMTQSDLVVRFIPDLNMVVGCQNLADLYPRMKKRRPIVEAALMKDGSYWGTSLPELLEDIETELTINENLLIEAGEASVGPVIGYRPTAGANLKNVRWEPKMLLPLDNPNDDVKVITVPANVDYAIQQQQNLIGYAERLTGLSDMNVGRASDRPNAPRTARQTVALLDEGNIRLNLDIQVLRDDLTAILRYIWALDSQFSPPQVFYRVTESRPNGLYDSARGFGKMTAKERGGRYDFEIKFATGAHSREARKEALIELTTQALAMPLVQTNPNAQWKLMEGLFKAYGIFDWAEYIPMPPELDLPCAPETEFPRMLQGEMVHVHPMDLDDKHIQLHTKDVESEMKAPIEDRDMEAVKMMSYHIKEHMESKAQKEQQQAVQAGMAVIAGLAGNGEEGQGGAGQSQQGQPQPQTPPGDNGAAAQALLQGQGPMSGQALEDAPQGQF